ncbi:hypothetical protein [Streptomyces aquilus]|uniref:hypothetical protein n=1 Tax=Streptomyces aquilus TaxID=2548456 RepID=UPI0036ACA12D
MSEGEGEGGARGYRQADAATLRRWEAWASEARTQLAAAGLPVQAEYMEPAVGGGAVVEVDPGDDATGGVYVGWQPASVLRTAGQRLSVHTEHGLRVLRHKRAVTEAIVEAMRAVLTRGGFTVKDSPDEYSLGSLYLVSPPGTPLLDMLEGPASSGEETGPS